jgi:hypothetical protein
LEILSGYLDNARTFDPSDVDAPLVPAKIEKLKKALLRCVQHVNTLKKLLRCDGKQKGSYAYDNLEECFQRCFVNVLRRRLALNLNTSQLIKTFQNDKAFFTWYE